MKLCWMILICGVILLILALIFVLVWYFEGKSLSEKTFVCGSCGKKFSPKWWKAGFSAHMGENTVLQCPHCGKKGFCPLSYEEK